MGLVRVDRNIAVRGGGSSPNNIEGMIVVFRRLIDRSAIIGLAMFCGLLPVVANSQTPVEPAQVHDPENPDFKMLQSPSEATARFPRDKNNRVDWVTALRRGRIEPRANVAGDGKMDVFNLDVIMKNTAGMPYVTFPHEPHTQWLACSNCHGSIFFPKAGANPINMTKIFRGEYCGVCHGRVAFSAMHACERCHNVLHGDLKAWW